MPEIRKVLIANRGEIAVRIARACADAGIASVAVYADPDRAALHVTLADEAFALGGARAAETYLDVDKLLDVARRSGADAVHPGYGFLAENAGFAARVIEEGLVWIGPPPAAIEALGDKVSARHIAHRAGAPLVAGTPDPVSGADEVTAFAAEHGLPIAIKAAFGGGGRGLKVARTADEITDQYESAVREATAAFGRGECFVERYLDSPRHVETQCLADMHGTVVVVSTRDCSLQRRHQKLVEEAPAPFLTPEQEQQLHTASRAILREAGYVGAGTCEFLVAVDGTVSFLEVNTRLQVEHPVTEEVTGIDLVREQLRIAAGEPLGYTEVATRGHSIEFRINGEDPAAGFLPMPGRIATLRVPSGPGVRWDSGVVEGDTVSGAFDSMIAKLVVTGATRTQAVERARRALAELDGRGHPHGDPVPPCGARRPGIRACRPDPAVHRAHPLDRDRVRRPAGGATARRCPVRGRRARGAEHGARRGRGRWQADRGRAAGRSRAGARSGSARAPPARRAHVADRPARPSPAPRSPRPCRARSSRSRWPKAPWSPRATWWWSSRP